MATPRVDSENAEFLRPGVAAAMLGVHENTLRNWCQNGYIDDVWVTPGGESRPSRAEVQMLVRLRSAEPINKAYREWAAG